MRRGLPNSACNGQVRTNVHMYIHTLFSGPARPASELGTNPSALLFLVDAIMKIIVGLAES